MAGGSPAIPDCPNRPICYRVSIRYSVDPEGLHASVLDALRVIGARLTSSESWLVSAEAEIGPFIDDVTIGTEPASGGSVVTVRSASRVGGWDLGVNRRRVRRIVRILDARHPRLTQGPDVD
jgi:uncharacterized protein (DUF1499 family)